MALIAMAVHDTEENGRSELTRKTLGSLSRTVDLDHDRLFIIDNGSCGETKILLDAYFNTYFGKQISIITLPENIGTAKAINLAWKERKPGEHCIKMDNDVVINQSGWVEEMEAAIEREPQIGIIGLKRKDLAEYPGNPNKQYNSELLMLPHQPYEKWIVVERVKHVMGTCQMYNSALLDKIGFLYQPSLYGYDDTISSYRCNIAQFLNVFLPHIDIDHIDPGGTDYTKWKQDQAAEYAPGLIKIINDYISGARPIYEPCE
jgi:GT2 family glycosyltransferase